MQIALQYSSLFMESPLNHSSPIGASDEAKILRKELSEIREDERKRVYVLTPRPVDTENSTSSMIDEIESVASECSEKNWDGYQSEPILEETILNAKKLIQLIPESLPNPEVLPEPDGFIGFEWDFGEGKWMIISTDKDGYIYYAVKFDDSTKTDGRIDFEKVNLIIEILKLIC